MKTSVFMAGAMLISGAAIAQTNGETGAQNHGLSGTAQLTDPGDDRTIADGPYEEHAAALTNIYFDKEYTGMGGPLEDETDYPPCRPGPGDDRCIQLYERGVAGAGN
jgi:hypothetical protein